MIAVTCISCIHIQSSYCHKILFLDKNGNLEMIKPYHVANLITHHDVWSVSVTKMLNILPAIFEKYPKMLLFYAFYHNTHMN